MQFSNNISKELQESIRKTVSDTSNTEYFYYAEFQYKIILKSIEEFEKELDDEHEIALKLTNFGKDVLMIVEKVGYHNPCLIHYYGIVNGVYSEILQHTSQINFMITSVKKTDPSKPARRIGFIL